MDEALIIGFYDFNYVELGSAEPALWFGYFVCSSGWSLALGPT
jgi:hypothetical protein